MKGTNIELMWTKGKREYHKELDREALYAVFKGLADGYEKDNDNIISKKMVENIIPYADKIFIDKDYNDTQDIPMIIYEIDRKKNVLKIIRYHKIVWAILDKYCTT